MKKVLFAFATALLLVGCAKEYDDTELKNRVTTLETKVGNLEAQIKAVQAVALGQYVQKVEQTAEGVTVTYGDGTVVTLKVSTGSGTGVLGVIKEGDVLYWAIDGTALTYDGKKLPVSQVTNIYVKNGKLYAVIAGTETELGGFSGGASLQDGIFTNIEVTDQYVVLTLSDNSKVNIPIGSAFKLVIAKTQYKVTTTDAFDVPYTVNAKTAGTEVDIFTDANFKATVEADKFVITPKVVAEGTALAYADSKVGLTSIVKLTFGAEEEAPYANPTDPQADPENNIDYVGDAENGAVDAHIVSNVSLDKESIKPQVSWITVADVKANNYTVTFALEDNTTGEIRTGEVFIYEAGTENKVQTIVIAQKASEIEYEQYNPAGWNKVFNMADYKTNSTFIWNDAISLNPSAVTLQWKFYANKWNDHKFNDKDAAGNQLFSNRLGEFANADESKSVLFRFSNDGDADGQLCLNAGVLGVGQAQVTKDGKAYAWPAQEWVVMTIVSDGSKVHVYKDGTLINSYDASPAASWDLNRVDLSMTWDDGSNWPLKQAFNGYTAYIRVWSRALAASEIEGTICEVPANADGLEACWNFDGAEEKAAVNSAAKNAGVDLDFTSCYDGNGNTRDNGDAAAAAWVTLAGSEIDGICSRVKSGDNPGGDEPGGDEPGEATNPEGWNKVFNMADYKTNSTFIWNDAISLNPSAVTLQWKFYANKWNDHKFNDKDAAGNQLFSNRLGEFANADESKSVLFRFSNDGDADGQLCLNAGVLGVGQAQVTKDGKAYAWPAQEWVVMTIVSDGSKVHVYQNGTLINSYDASPAASWDLNRVDLSMTWDDGSNWPLKQAFNGYTAYIRVWSRALAASEIEGTLCEVPANADGLEACWNFDGTEDKAVANSAAKNVGMDLDFTSCYDGNGNAKDNGDVAAASWLTLAGSDIPGICYK